MWSVGVDVHARISRVCVLDQNGKPVREFVIRGVPRRLVEALGELRKPFAVCFEAPCGYGYLFDQLRRIARRVVVAHPG
jgi:hypothetical protein